MSARRRRRRYESFNEGRVGPWRRSKSRERTRHFSLRLFISILLVLIPHCILLSAPVHKLQLHGKRKQKTGLFFSSRPFLPRPPTESGSRLFLRPSETAETRKVFFYPLAFLATVSTVVLSLPFACFRRRRRRRRRTLLEIKCGGGKTAPHEERRRRESSDGR